MLFSLTSRAKWSSLQKAAATSAVLHLSLSFWVWSDWSLQEQERKSVTIPVEVLTVAPVGNIPKPKVEEEKKRKKTPPPPAVKKPPPPKADKKKNITKKKKPKVKPMPVKKAKKAKRKNPDAELQKVLSGILKNVEKVEPRPVKKKQRGTTIRNLPNSASREENASRPLSLSQIEALQEHFARCWNIPAGAREGAKLKVKINVKVSPMGDITSAAIAPNQNMSNPFARAAAESALRAVESPLCNKVDLPIEQYSLWKDMTLNFDPAMLLGG